MPVLLPALLPRNVEKTSGSGDSAQALRTQSGLDLSVQQLADIKDKQLGPTIACPPNKKLKIHHSCGSCASQYSVWGSQGSLRHDMTKEEHVVTAATATELSPLPHAFAHLQCWPRLEETMSLCNMSNDKCCHCNMLYGCFSIKQNHLVLPQKCPPKFSSNSFIVQ